MESTCGAHRILGEIVAALEAVGVCRFDALVDLRAGGSLRSVFAVSDLAQASVAAAGVALARFAAVCGGREAGAVVVDRDLASAWFQLSIRPVGWELPPPWDPVAGDYRGVDGWVRLHTNAAQHRQAALPYSERPSIALRWRRGFWVEGRRAGGRGRGGPVARPLRCARSWTGASILKVARWPPSRCWYSRRDHGRPLRVRAGPVGSPDAGPLAGIGVLDLTRVLAGPAATRTLAGGARMSCGSTRPGGTRRRLFPR